MDASVKTSNDELLQRSKKWIKAVYICGMVCAIIPFGIGGLVNAILLYVAFSKLKQHNVQSVSHFAHLMHVQVLILLVIGAMASVVLICLVIIWFILAMAGHATMDMLSGGIGKKERTDRIDENGKRIQVTDLGNGDYEGVGGERYRDCGSHIERL